MQEFKLPSGAVLKVSPAPFPEAKALLQVFLREAKGIQFVKWDDVQTLAKDAFCTAFSSVELEWALLPCLERCLYNGQSIKVDATFEPVKAREDYIEVCYMVAKENLSPFTKSLYAQLKELIGKIEGLQA